MEEFNMKTYIYVLRDPISLDIRYVGKTTCLKRRLKSHKCAKSLKGTHLSSWLVSLKEKNLIPLMEQIDVIEDGGWKEKESYYIKFYKDKGCNLVNLTTGGEGCEGYKHTEFTRKKMRKAHERRIITFIPSMRGIRHTDESKNKMSVSQTGIKNHQYGKKISDETKIKISKKLGTEVEINGIKYISLREAARKLNMQWATFKYRYKNNLISQGM